jgi:4-hydroxybenzoate polyprenyltransferase
MKLSVALRLGRVSNLPTVTSNVLAAVALSGVSAGGWTVAALCVAMSMMYVAGMFLNDAFDRDIDRVERPERPIPSGEVSAEAVFDAGFALLGGGIVVVAITALASGAGWKPVLAAIALASLIIIYDAFHKKNPLAPLVMGLCRAGVYVTAALVVVPDPGVDVWLGVAAMVSYLIGLTYVARHENRMSFDGVWPLVFLAVPFGTALPRTPLAIAIYVVLFAWIVRALGLVARRRIRDAVVSLIAGISLVDALWIARAGSTAMAVVAIVAFLITNWLQRAVPGT